MIDGYLKVAAITPKVRVADVEFNCNEICRCIDDAVVKKVKLIVFPELGITGYTCQDLFFQDRLLEAAKEALIKIAKRSQGVDALVFVGLPLAVDGKLYNVAAALCNGEILELCQKHVCLIITSSTKQGTFIQAESLIQLFKLVGKM